MPPKAHTPRISSPTNLPSMAHAKSSPSRSVAIVRPTRTPARVHFATEPRAVQVHRPITVRRSPSVVVRSDNDMSNSSISNIWAVSFAIAIPTVVVVGVLFFWPLIPVALGICLLAAIGYGIYNCCSSDQSKNDGELSATQERSITGPVIEEIDDNGQTIPGTRVDHGATSNAYVRDGVLERPSAAAA